ncbi:hypothetical protein M3Y98_00441000 [Aphelenchoides besseyi]|nr:hypothetical protein M3Y98_00441000 [Aphelenchoides besseyi]
MSVFAKKVIELERLVQQTFLHVIDYCEHGGNFSWGLTSPTYDLEQEIAYLTKQIGNLRKLAESDEQIEMYAKEVVLLDQSAARLDMTMQMINAHLAIRTMPSAYEAGIIFEHTKEAFTNLCMKFPFSSDDPLESPTMEKIYSLMLSEYSFFITPEEIMPSSKVTRSSKKKNDKLDEMHRVLVEVERLLDVPTLDLKENLCKLEGTSAHAHEWLNNFMFEKCKVSTRTVEIMQIIQSLFEKLINEKQTHAYSKTIYNIINMFIARAVPEGHHGNDDIVYFNDSMYILIELERHKSDFVCALHQIVWDFNFNDLINSLRKSARLVLKRYLTFIQKQHLTWSDKAVELYLNSRYDEFTGVMHELDRFSKIWKDICSKNTYQAMIMIVCAGILLHTYKSLLQYDDYTHQKEFMTTDVLYQTATKRLNAVKFCLERSQFDIQQECNKVQGGQLRGVLTEKEINRLANRYV